MYSHNYFHGSNIASDYGRYFKLNTPLHNPFVRNTTNYLTFEFMTKFLHFSDTTNISEDPLHKFDML